MNIFIYDTTTYNLQESQAFISFKVILTEIDLNELHNFYEAIKHINYSLVTPAIKDQDLTLSLEFGSSTGMFQESVNIAKKKIFAIAAKLTDSTVKINMERTKNKLDVAKARVTEAEKQFIADKNQESGAKLHYFDLDRRFTGITYYGLYYALPKNNTDASEIIVSLLEQDSVYCFVENAKVIKGKRDILFKYISSSILELAKSK